MKINVSGLLKDIDANVKINRGVEIPFISYNGQDIPVNGPIEVKAEIVNTGDHLIINGTIRANLQLICSRCLENLDFLLETAFEEELSNQDDDDEFVHFDGEVIDITGIVINNICLSLPMKTLCSEECKGLCPICGKNMNKEKCNCKEDDIDPRFMVLKDLISKN